MSCGCVTVKLVFLIKIAVNDILQSVNYNTLSWIRCKKLISANIVQVNGKIVKYSLFKMIVICNYLFKRLKNLRYGIY